MEPALFPTGSGLGVSTTGAQQENGEPRSQVMIDVGRDVPDADRAERTAVPSRESQSNNDLYAVVELWPCLPKTMQRGTMLIQLDIGDRS